MNTELSQLSAKGNVKSEENGAVEKFDFPTRYNQSLWNRMICKRMQQK